MEELARPQRLGDAVREVQPGHLLVPDLGVDAVELGALQPLDEGEGVADRGQQNVAARLVGLGLDGELQVVALLDDVLAEEIEGLLHPVQGGPYVLGRPGLRAFPSAPGHIGAGAQLGGQVDVAECLAQRVAADAAVVGGEGAVLEDGVGEEVGGCHRDDQAGGVQCLPEAFDGRLALDLAGAEGDQVVVVEGDAVRAEVGEAVDRLDGVQGPPGGVPEGVAALPADGPQAEAELVPGHGLTAHRGSLDHFVNALYKFRHGQTNMRQHTGEPPGPRPWDTGRQGRVHDGRTVSGTAGRRGGQLDAVHQGAGRGCGDRRGHRPGPGPAHGQRRRRQGERPRPVVAGTGRGAGAVRRRGAAGLGAVRRRSAARAGRAGRGR